MDKTKKTQHGAAKKRKAAHRVFALLISALVVIGIAFAAVLIIKRINTVARKKSLPIRPETEYAYTGDGFVYIEGKKLNFYSVKNEDKNYSMSVEADNVKLVGTDKIKVIYNSSSIQIIGTRFDNMLNGELKKIVCGDKYVAVYLKNENGTHSLRAFNSSERNAGSGISAQLVLPISVLRVRFLLFCGCRSFQQSEIHFQRRFRCMI